MKSIFLYHHLGLGDHIICNGMVRFLLREEKLNFLYLPTKPLNMDSVSQIYSDDKRVICIPVKETGTNPLDLPQAKLAGKVMVAGFGQCRYDWDVSFYDSVGVSFDERWNSFLINRNKEIETTLKTLVNPHNVPFVLVHSQGSDGIDIPINVFTDKKIVRVTPTRDKNGKIFPIGAWSGLIEEADEVHCIDSSFIHLAQSLRAKNGVFHDARKGFGKFSLRDRWSVVNYK